jgi:O-succinylbenzoate synthase
MKIERIILRLVRIPLKFEFQNRWQRIREWRKLIVEVQCETVSGYGECTAMETPYYSYETIDTASWVIKRWLAERILNRSLEHPLEVGDAFSLICGHNEGKAALECACWDLYARMHSTPLYELIGGLRRKVSAGATVGVKPDLEAALAAVDSTVSAGYERIKLKIKPGWDKELLAAVRSRFPQIVILADANGAYEEADMDWLASLERFAPIILEQPFAASAWKSHSNLQARTSMPICLDESIRSLEDVEQMIYMKAGRILNLKVGRVGGIANSMRIHDRCAESDIPVFIGSKIETGIGRWMNICVGTLGNVRYPSDVSASERYFVEEIVRDPVKLVGPGVVEPMAGPGFGTDIDAEKLLKYTVKTEVIPQ